MYLQPPCLGTLSLVVCRTPLTMVLGSSSPWRRRRNLRIAVCRDQHHLIREMNFVLVDPFRESEGTENRLRSLCAGIRVFQDNIISKFEVASSKLIRSWRRSNPTKISLLSLLALKSRPLLIRFVQRKSRVWQEKNRPRLLWWAGHFRYLPLAAGNL